jgi:CxxC motif-containing protein
MNDRLTCILCPIGCELEVETDGGEIRVRENQCDKGLDFAAEEILRPKRNLATSVPLAGTADRMLSVRLSERVPRESVASILAEIVRLRPSPPVRRGDVLIPNVCGSGADVIATRTIGDALLNP